VARWLKLAGACATTGRTPVLGRAYWVPRVEFNAHRVFAPVTVLDALSGLDLVSFSVVDDRGPSRKREPSGLCEGDVLLWLFEYTKPIGVMSEYALPVLPTPS